MSFPLTPTFRAFEEKKKKTKLSFKPPNQAAQYCNEYLVERTKEHSKHY